MGVSEQKINLQETVKNSIKELGFFQSDVRCYQTFYKEIFQYCLLYIIQMIE